MFDAALLFTCNCGIFQMFVFPSKKGRSVNHIYPLNFKDICSFVGGHNVEFLHVIWLQP